MNVHNDVLISCSKRMEFTICENGDEFGEEDVIQSKSGIGRQMLQLLSCMQSELLLSQKQRIGLALPGMGRVSGRGEAKSRLTVWRAGTELERELPVF